MHFGGLEDDRKDSTAPHITLRPQLGAHLQCGLAICTFHLGFSLVRPRSGLGPPERRGALLPGVGAGPDWGYWPCLGSAIDSRFARLRDCHRVSGRSFHDCEPHPAEVNRNSKVKVLLPTCEFGTADTLVVSGVVLIVTSCPLKEAAALPTRSCSRAADSSAGAAWGLSESCGTR